MELLKRHARYLKKTKDVHYFFPKEGEMRAVFVARDADWAGDLLTRRSTSGGWIHMLRALHLQGGRA